MSLVNYDTYLSTLTFLLNGRRQNLCWLMSHCSLDREDKWRDAQFKIIQNEIDSLQAEYTLAVQEIGAAND